MLNTKYSIPPSVNLPEGIIVIHWHKIAKAIRDYLEVLPGNGDHFSKDFLEFLDANDMGPLEELGSGDAGTFSNFRQTKLKFDYVLDEIGSHFKQLGYSTKADANLTYDNPWYGIKLSKGDYTSLFNYHVWFSPSTLDETSTNSLSFVCQVAMKDERFEDFITSKYSAEISQVTRESGATFDAEWWNWTISKTIAAIDAKDLEVQKEALLTFSIESLAVYRDTVIPLLEKAAKAFTR